ncbi:RdgB/HAM1 family non-canonical purine NTP pyrophosphatase [Candidatus Paracaedibacter symbiosus]|uniref:RdgB/HAM1 family non-canonical purine NTP pyrophosphatase n=1 Tax=Candidatus Paracaedibacter symbiosus TaxID=244582 RepID=UPI0005097522|nr:RdgB/HAM1 family non-canonical purine NTP pyrophosphatase [Candidatus Paracaedibacter symbiosus]
MLKFPTKKLVIASHNEGKVKEIRELVLPLGFAVATARELKLPEPEETGTTFVANSQVKAKEIAAASNLPSLADDSGLVVPALNGDPGIFSARWAEVAPGKRDFDFAINKVGELLHFRNTPASMVCVLSIAWPDGTCHSFEGIIQGTLQFPPRGTKGFGYDPIFMPEGFDQTFGEMDPAFKHSISHRAQAFALFLEYLKGE